MIRLDNQTAQDLRRLLRDLRGVEGDAGEMITRLEERVEKALSVGMEDAGLIDRLVSLFSDFSARLRISGREFGQLREILLFPAERERVLRNLAETSLKCAGCGHELGNGELIRGSHDGGQSTLSCAWCMIPTWVHCRKCGAHRSLSPKLRDILQKFITTGECETCKQKKENAPAVAQGEEERGAVNRDVEVHVDFREPRAEQRFAVRPLQPPQPRQFAEGLREGGEIWEQLRREWEAALDPNAGRHVIRAGRAGRAGEPGNDNPNR